MMTTYSEIRKRREAVLRKFGTTKNATETKKASYITQPTQEEDTNKGGFFGGFGYTLEKLGLGVVRAFEGISDYVVGGVADLFGADDFADELMKSDWLNYEHADEWYNPSGAMEFVGDVAGGVGGMLPAIGLSFVPGAGPALSTAAFMTSAAGQNVSEAAKQSGEAGGKEWLYGTLSGAAEGGIEALSGGIGGTQAGKVLGKQLAKTTAGKIATGFVAEGLEEVAADIVDPALKRITGVDKEAKVDWANLPKTFFVGGTTGAVLGGAGQIVNAAKAGGFNNANAVKNAQEMSERLADNNVRQAKDKKLTYTQEDINTVRDRLSQNLQKMDEKTRSSFLASNKQIASHFNADGTVKEFAATNNNERNSGDLASYSASLQGREAEFAYKPVSVDGKVSENAKKVMRNVELLTNGKTDIVLTDQDILTADGQKANGVYRNGVLYLDARASSYDKAMFVGSHELAHTLEGTQEYKALGDFIAETINSNPELQKKYNINRYMEAYANAQSGDYSAETKQYESTTEMYADFIANEILSNEDTVRRLVNRNRNVVVRMLNWVRDAIKRLGMNKEDREAYNAMKKAEKLLSAALDAGRGGVSLDEIEEGVKGKKETAERSSTDKLAEARYQLSEKLNKLIPYTNNEIKSIKYNSNHLVASGYSDIVEFIKTSERKGNNSQVLFIGKINDEVASFIEREIGINVKGKSISLSSDNLRHIFSEHGNAKTEGDRGQISITTKNIEDIIETIIEPDKVSKEINKDGSVSVLFEKKLNGRNLAITVLSNKKNTLTLKSARIFKNSISPSSDAEAPRSTSKTLGGMNDSSTSIIRKNSEKSTENAKKVEKRFSFDVDSNGNQLSKEQTEFYKDSKARDNQGRLQVVYHGTEGEFYTFDKALRGSVTGVEDAKLGFFFTSSKTVAHDYAVEAYDHKYLNLMHKIANGDRKVLSLLSQVDGYKELAVTEDTKEFGELQDKGERYEHDIMELYLNIENPLVEDWQGKPYKKGRMLKLVTRALQGDYDGVIIRNIDDTLDQTGKDISDIFVVFEPNQIKLTTNKKPTSNEDIRFSVNVHDNKITSNMTDDQRYEVLKGKSIALTAKADNTKLKNVLVKLEHNGKNVSYDAMKMGDKIKLFKKIGEEFGVFKEYSNKTITLSFEYSRGSLDESMHKQKRNFNSFAKMLTCFDTVIENAVGIEVHNRNEEGYKADNTLKNVYVLASAFEDGENIIPVKLEIKEFSDKKNTLYVAIALESIKKDEIMRQEVAKGVAQQVRPSSSIISIPDLFANVNPQDESFYKYIPKKFLKGDNQRFSIATDKVAGIRRVTEEEQKPSTKERIAEVKAKAAEGWLASQIQFTNVQAGIEEAGKRLGLDLKGKVQKARSARGAALNMITEAQMDYRSENVVGKSLTEIFEPIHKRGDEYTAEFYEYLLHWHNIDRMSLEKQGLENKPVFGESVTATESRKRIAELQKKHTVFVQYAKEIWNYNQNLLQRRVDAGLITQEMADELNKIYPHYVPTFRDMEGAPGTGRAGTKNSKYAVEVKKTIKTAKGSNLDILDISLMMANQTQAVLRAEAINELANELYEGAVSKNDFSDVAVKDVVDLKDPDVDYEAEKPKNNEVVFYKDGKRITIAVSQPVFVGFESFNGVIPFNDPVVKSLEKVNEIFKKAVTQWNPLFLVRNAVRDFQEAIFYTKNGIGKYIANLPNAIKIMAKKGKLWQQYLAMGGVSSGYFNNETGIYDRSGKVKKGLKKASGMLGIANEFIEQIPRFNEFVLSVQSGKSLEDALLDAADVTTNFSRGGKITKVMNRTLIPFLNPSVQGWSKLWRTATGRKTARQWTALVVKALAFGLSVGLINDLVNGDDEEYQALNTSDKENYFIIRAGDKFIKIPKGRVVAALGSVASRTKDFLQGDEKAFDGWLSSVSTMISPVESASRTIFSPFADVQTNTTWYGGQIESQRLQSLAPSERYDESTSSIAIALSKYFNPFDYSPKQIHYLIDQYSGIIGDIILPATTAKAERDMFSAAFTIDPVLSNGISTEFYDLIDETTYAKNAGDPTAVLKLRYLNEVSNAVSDMYQQKRDIANNADLSDKEKQEQTRVVQALINETLSSAINGSMDFEQILLDSGYEMSATALVENSIYQSFTAEQQTSAARKLTEYYYAKAYSKISGGEYSYKYHLYEAAGVEKTAIYLTEIAAIKGEKDKTGKTISDSRKKKVQAYIQKLRLSAMQKYILLYLAGYSPSDTGKEQINTYLRSKGFSKEDIEIFWG